MAVNRLNIVSLLFAACLLSCSKSSESSSDREKPEITLVSPADNQQFSGSQLIHIRGAVTDNKYIREIHLEITDLDSGVEYLHVHIHPASDLYTFDQTYLLQPSRNYKIRVIADDAGSNSSVKQVHITCN